ncbi:MAG: hypothetical protein J0I43_06685 [Microbacterium sp.]|uniref:hypothetical protein n=1 Tax=Microbacterium sp. TaxID=51671 RepID=UPI001AC2DB8B|nr:hypothetical protein [Microbacterium sp.]MBN9177038.1 hypothetical protein [Microbacterium sp.]
MRSRAPRCGEFARAAGVGRGRLRGRDLGHPHHGVYVAAAFDDLVDRCAALSVALGPQHWFSHLTSARLWGIPLPRRHAPIEPLHVLTVGGRVPVRHHHVVGRVTSDDPERGMHAGLRMIGPVVTWCHLATRGAVTAGSLLDRDALVIAADVLTTKRRLATGRTLPPLAAAADLVHAVEAHTGRGTRLLREALALVRPGAESPRETLLRLRIVEAGLPEPTVQLPVATTAGILYGDLGYERQRIVLEYQGDEHRTSRWRWLSDLTRVQLLQDAGYDVILVGADDLVPDPIALLARIGRALARENAR